MVLFGFESRKQSNSDFQSHFFMSKIDGIFLIFFSLKNIKKGAQLLLLTYFHNFDFKCTLFSKSVPNFWPSKPKRTKSLEFFYTHQVGVEAKLNSAKLSFLSEVTLMAWCTSHFFRQIELLSTYYQGLNLSYLMHHVVVLVCSYMANSLPSFFSQT